MTIQRKSHTQLIDAFLAVVEAETGVKVDTRVGSVLRALASGAATNDLFVQTIADEVAANSRLQTADDDAADTFVAQFTPAFQGRIPAASASQAPVVPTLLTASATATHLLVANVQKLYADQQLRLLRLGKEATVDVTAVEPTTTLTSTVTNGATSLPVASTEGMFPDAVLRLVDGNYSVDVTITAVAGPNTVNITPLSSVLTHTYAVLTTEVTLLNVVAYENFAGVSGALVADFVTGTEVRAVTMLEGLKMYRNVSDGTIVTIPAKTSTTDGYRVQTSVGAIQYEVAEDLLNPYYDSTAQAYKMPASATEVYVKVTAVTAGDASNVEANQLTVMPTPLLGIDGVTNPYAIANGTDRETTPAMIERFQTFMASRGGTNLASIESAVAAVSSDIQFTIIENVASDGVTPQPGNFVVLVSDTSGTLSTALYDAVDAAVYAARAITTTYDIVPPQLSTPTVVIKVTVLVTDNSTTEAAVRDIVRNAAYDYFQALASGTGWTFNDLLALVMEQDYVVDCTYLTINGNGYDRTSGTFALVGTGPTNGSIGALTMVRPPLANITVS